MYHGELVAFGTLVQLILEDRPDAEVAEVIQFCVNVGLPVSFAELCESELTRDELMTVAVSACDPGSFMDSEPFTVTPEMVYSALVEADIRGRTFQGNER
jgi:glycerol dehydrogenase